jgi:ubiquinone/menaquinone biosynthesis C-methylase UbiE
VEEAQLLHEDYTLGHSAEEHERLLYQGRFLEPATRRVFHAVGVKPGWTCLDFACGPGAIMQLMGELAGPTGRVTGIDRDARAGHAAVARLQATGTSRYRFIEADMESIDDIGGEQFDLTFGRLALLYTRDPVALLRKMYSWTKPGGCIAVQDYDLRTMSVYPEFEACSELMRINRETHQRQGWDMEFGLKLPVLFAEAGIGAPDGTDVNLPLTPLEPFARMYSMLCRSLLPKAIEFGVTTEAHMQNVFREVELVIASGRPHSVLWPLMIGAWKRKPAV